MTGEPAGIVGIVAEDDPALLWFVVGVLSAEGYSILPASHGQEALRLITARGRAVKFVLTDAQMPEMGGLELLRRIRQQFPSIKVILMSGEVAPKLHGADAFIQKPFTATLLRETVTRVLKPPK